MAHLFEPFPKQQEFIGLVMSGEYAFVFFGGAIRGGKTFVILGLFIMLCYFYPGSKYVICRKDIEILRATTLKSFNQIVPKSITAQMPSAHNQWEWMTIPIKDSNGVMQQSVIRFFSENISRDPDLMNFRGLEYDSIAFDEMDITQETFEKAFERAGTWKMNQRKSEMESGRSIPPRVVLGTSNPQDGWVKKDIYDKYIEGTLKSNYFYLVSKVYDNPNIPEDWIQNQKENMTPLDFLKFVEGDWEVDKNRKKYFENYDDKVHYSSQKFDFDLNTELWLSFDFNYNPTTCSVYQVFDDCIICMRNYGIEGGTRKLCELMKEDEELMKVPKLFWTVTGDTNGSNKTATAGNFTDYDIIQEIFELQDVQFINVHSRNKAHVYSRRLCDHFLWKAPFVMDNRVSRLRNDLLIAKPVEDSNDLYKNRKKGFGMDFLDTFRYFVDAKFPNGIEDINRFVELVKIKSA